MFKKPFSTFSLLTLALSFICRLEMTQAATLTSPQPGVPYSGTSSPANSGLKPLPPMPPAQPSHTTPPAPAAPIFTPKPPPPPVSQTAGYFHPGVLVSRGGGWEGGDDLFNLSNSIGIYVEIVKPQNASLSINEDGVRKIVESIFNSKGIRPVTLAPANQPPLPFFQIQLLIYPINRGYVACCVGKLFESVTLSRIILDPGTAFQAITWEKSNLLVTPTEAFADQVDNSIADIATAFAERFQAFEERKREVMTSP